MQRLEAAGHQVANQSVISRRFQRFAGSDAERLQDINALARLSPLPDIILAVRGGYGVTRLLEQIDYSGLKQQLAGKPTALCGHSDLTALQLALLAKTGLITFSGPMLSGNFGAPELSEFTAPFLAGADRTGIHAAMVQQQRSAARAGRHAVGRQPAMLMTLPGTPWLPLIEGGILVIEDINEHPFRIERMLLQLHQCGVPARQRAIVVGSFTGFMPSAYDNGFDFAVVWQRIRDITGLPVIDGLDFGHDWQTVTLPLGRAAS